MKNKYNLRNMINRFLGSTNIKLLVFLFLGVFVSKTGNSQNCQVLDSVLIDNVQCYGGSDGSINLYYDLTGNYSVFWANTGSILDSISDVSSGTYLVTITDLNNPTCYLDTNITISQPQDPLNVVVNLSSDVECHGDSTGVANAEDAIGGTAPYSYLWDNGEVTQQATQLWAGIHTVTVTDANQCTAQASVTVQNLYPPITANIDIITNALYAPYSISCFGACDAQVAFSASGGDNSYIYFWDIGQVYNGTGNDTASNLCYGGHNILVEDGLGCREIFTYTLTQPDELFASAIMHQPVRCFGEDNGMALANATQGNPPYIFTWDSLNGPSGIDTSSNQISGNFIDSLTPGIHTVYVTDANGCTSSDTVMITEPTLLEVEIIDSLTIYPYCTNTNSGELCAVASGGTPSYIYAWNDVLGQITPCAVDLQPQFGSYTITVQDDRNCQASASFQLDSVTNSMNPDSVIIIEDPVSCFGLYDGELTATNVVGGVGPYTYDWFGPGLYTGTGSNISSLYYGSYSVFISDANGCNITVSSYLNQPDELIYSIYNTVDETCAGSADGQIWVDVSGGTGSYYYDSSENGVFPIDPNNLVQLVNDSLIFNVSPGGLDTLYVTDENNCEGAVAFGTGIGGFATAAITPIVTVPVPNLSVLNNTSCYNVNDGAAMVVDPDPLFTYTWEEDDLTNPGNPNGIDLSNGAGPYWGAFPPGFYYVVAQYADSASFGLPYSGCDNYTTFTITAGTTPIVDGENLIDVSCFGENTGQIELNLSGGNAPYELVMDDGLFDTISNVNISHTFNNLVAGTYSLTIVDNNGCIAMESYIIDQALPLISDIIPTHASCFGKDDGEALVEIATGSGTSPFGFEWMDDSGVSLGQPVANAVDLFAGIYIVEVTDALNCLYVDTIQILEPPSPVTEVEIEDLYFGDFDVRCHGESNASAFAIGSGTTFEWFNDAGSLVATGQNTGPVLSAGDDFYVEATDVNGCLGVEKFDISEPDELIVNVDEHDYPGGYQISCYDANDGKAELEIEGGVEDNIGTGYNITWTNDNGDVLASPGDLIIENLDAGYSYTANVVDANGCEEDATTIEYTQPIEFDANVTTLNYPGPFHGPSKISFVDSTESDESYRFDWDWDYDGDYDEDKTGVESDDFETFENEFEDLDTNYVFVMLTNEVTLCQDSVDFKIVVQGVPEISDVFTPNDDGINDSFSFSEYSMQSVDVEIYNRWGQLVYSWSGPNKAWTGIGIDGKPVSQGVYFYVFKADGVDGHYYENQGSVTLLR